MSPSTSDRSRRQLESTVAAIQLRHGAQAIRPARDFVSTPVLHISMGFPELDAITGCAGVPLGALTLLSGPGTSGKLTLAYKTLASAQNASAAALAPVETAILLDLTCTADPDYLQRCGVDLVHLLIVRPQEPRDSLPLLLDLLHSRRARILLVDGLPEMIGDRSLARAFNASLSHLRQLARTAACAVLFVDDSPSPWQRWLGMDAAAVLRQNAALHVDLRRERWLRREGTLVGYQARARVLRSRWRNDTPSVAIELVFNGTVRARATW